MSLPNLQELLKRCIFPSFMDHFNWLMLPRLECEQQSLQNLEFANVFSMCRLVESVYTALKGHQVSPDECCQITRSNEYNIIHSFLEAYTNDGELTLVKDLEEKFKQPNNELVNDLKVQINSIIISRNDRGVSSKVQLNYKISQARDGFFMVSSSSEKLIHDFECPISHQFFDDPVTADDGHTYNRADLQKWYDEGNRNCPLNREKKLTNPQDIPTNHTIKKLMESSNIQSSPNQSIK